MLGTLRVWKQVWPQQGGRLAASAESIPTPSLLPNSDTGGILRPWGDLSRDGAGVRRLRLRAQGIRPPLGHRQRRGRR
eukprot:2912236-Pyramimonas_sp.AAC.1